MAWGRGGHNLVSISSLFHSLTPNAEKDVEPQELPFIAGRNAKWYSPFGNSVVLPYRTKSTLTI